MREPDKETLKLFCRKEIKCRVEQGESERREWGGWQGRCERQREKREGGGKGSGRRR